MKIITISREFGSGGRELGKRLAQGLNIGYYDTEILTEISKMTNLDQDFITNISEQGIPSFNLHFGHTFGSAINQTALDVVVAQQKVIKQIAEANNCVIVGRCADKILKDMNPLKIFVYADMDSKLKRCREKNPSEDLTDKQLIKKIKQIDNGRKRMYEFVTGNEWGDHKNYNICINTSGLNIKSVVPCLVDYAKKWFDE